MSEHDRLRGSGECAHWQIDNFMADLSWIDATFTNSWSDYSASSYAASYCIDGWGFVHLRGAIKNASASGTSAFTLPVGYRPSYNKNLPSDCYAGAYGRVTISPDGSVTPYGDYRYISLDGISFYAG